MILLNLTSPQQLQACRRERKLAYMRRWVLENKDKKRALDKAYYDNNVEARRAYEKTSSRRIARRACKAKKTGLPSPEYSGLDMTGLLSICSICLNMRPAVLDHCHKTGTFRGWICRQCNIGLGQFGDDPNTLIRASEYLQQLENENDSSIVYGVVAQESTIVTGV
jgi:Recombination endonuclease VII